jgi:hypothetical protein
MDHEEYYQIRKELLEFAEEVAAPKREEYTGQSQDILYNFKRIANRLGMSPLQVWAVYFNKHVDSVNTFIKGEASVSEPMGSRFADMLNYLFLGIALIIEEEQTQSPSQDPTEGKQEFSFSSALDEHPELGI